jgi:hypothetical protein
VIGRSRACARHAVWLILVDNLQAAFEAPQDKVADRIFFAGKLSVSIDRTAVAAAAVAPAPRNPATSDHVCRSHLARASLQTGPTSTPQPRVRSSWQPCRTSDKRIRLTKLTLAHNRF